MMQEQTSNSRRGSRQRGQTGWFGSSGSSTRGSRVRDHKTSGVYAEARARTETRGQIQGSSCCRPSSVYCSDFISQLKSEQELKKSKSITYIYLHMIVTVAPA